MGKKCAVPGCNVRISNDRLMCKPHWRLLSLQFRAYLWNCFKRARRGTAADIIHYGYVHDVAIKIVASPDPTTAATEYLQQFNLNKETAPWKQEPEQVKAAT